MASSGDGKWSGSAAMADFSVQDDVMYEIFHQLPPKSLFQCRRVCKQWWMLISNPIFVRDYIRRSPEPPPHNLLLLFSRYLGSSNPELGLCPLDDGHKISAFQSTSFPTRDFKLIGSHNGVLCLRTINKFMIYLWNPFIEEYYILPQASLKQPWSVGFGFNPQSGHLDDFVVVNIYENRSVEIYRFRTNTWKHIHNCYPPHLLKLIGRPVIFREFICWITHFDVNNKPLSSILLFDTVNEEFREIAGPDLIKSEGPYCYCHRALSLLGDRLVVMLWDQIKQLTQVWVMMEEINIRSGVIISSWTKLYEFGINNIRNHTPLGFIGDGVHILLKYNSREDIYNNHLSLYNVVERKLEQITAYSFNPDSCIGDIGLIKLFTYVESLVCVIPEYVRPSYNSNSIRKIQQEGNRGDDEKRIQYEEP